MEGKEILDKTVTDAKGIAENHAERAIKAIHAHDLPKEVEELLMEVVWCSNNLTSLYTEAISTIPMLVDANKILSDRCEQQEKDIDMLLDNLKARDEEGLNE